MKYYPEGILYDTAANRAALHSRAALAEAMEKGQILEAKAGLCTESHDLIVRLPGGEGVIPREEAAAGIKEGTVRDIAILSRVGRPVAFVIDRLEGEEGSLRAVLSRRKAQERCLRGYIGPLVPGDVIQARVTRLEGFGAFLDIGCGLPALMPIDMMSVSRISHPSQRFAPGQLVLAAVSRHENGRVTLTHKELLGSWEENAARFRPGETVRGIVRSVEEYGIFVELTPNLAGLAEKKPGIQPGMAVSVFIKSILPERMKVKLVIIEGFPDDDAPIPFDYRFQEGDHLSRWVYSPEGCQKRVETVFDEAD